MEEPSTVGMLWIILEITEDQVVSTAEQNIARNAIVISMRLCKVMARYVNRQLRGAVCPACCSRTSGCRGFHIECVRAYLMFSTNSISPAFLYLCVGVNATRIISGFSSSFSSIDICLCTYGGTIMDIGIGETESK